MSLYRISHRFHQRIVYVVRIIFYGWNFDRIVLYPVIELCPCRTCLEYFYDFHHEHSIRIGNCRNSSIVWNRGFVMKKILIRANHISKSYSLDSLEVRALSDVSFDIYDGEFLVILGPSGSGKSTMLNIIGGMDTLTEGEFFFDDVPMHHSSEKQLTFYRRDNIGFVFQFYNLMSNLTALENVRLSVEIAKDPFDEREILSSVGLDDRLHHFPMQLSGGEQQRVALARALCKNPKLLLCDEPTGALDSKTSIEILKVLKDFNSVYKKTVVIITHNAAIANMADRVFYLKDGQLIRVQENAHPCPVEELEL